jgi:hypothetical protein
MSCRPCSGWGWGGGLSDAVGDDALICRWQVYYSTREVPHFNGQAIDILLSFGDGRFVILATNDDRGALNVPLLV